MVLTGTFVSFFPDYLAKLSNHVIAQRIFGQPSRYKKVVRTYHRFGPVRSQNFSVLIAIFHNPRVTRPFIAQSVQFRY